jgi:hypothetical protein
LEDAGPESQHGSKSRILAGGRFRSIFNFQFSTTIENYCSSHYNSQSRAVRDSLPLRKQITFRVNTRPGAGRRVLPVGNAGLAKRRRDSEYVGSDKPPSNATRGKQRQEAPPFPPSCMSAMPVTASPPPRASPSLPLGPSKPSAQTELLPLRVIFVSNHCNYGRESLEVRLRIVGGRRPRIAACCEKSNPA